MQSGGIGGGSFFMLYDKEKSISKFLNCRETAPRSAHQDMFENSIDDSLKGGRSILIPGTNTVHLPNYATEYGPRKCN